MNSLKRIIELTKREMTMPFAASNQSELIKTKRIYSFKSTMLSVFVFSLLMGIADNYFSGTEYSCAKGILFAQIFSFLYFYMIMNEYQKKSNGEFAIMLPASSKEKFSAKILTYYIIIPLLLLIGCTLCYYLGSIAGEFIKYGETHLAFDNVFAGKILNTKTVSMYLMCVSLIFLLFSHIKNEIIQVITGILMLSIFIIFEMITARMPEKFADNNIINGFILSDWAVYLICPLITIILLYLSYVYLKKTKL